MSKTETKPKDNTPEAAQSSAPAVAEQEPLSAISLRFLSKVEKQFAAEMGTGVPWTDLQKALAQHLFIKIDQTFKAMNLKRQPSDQLEWRKVNMDKLALDAVHRVSLGLDALIPNHIHPIPYRNNKSGLFDLDLRIGYVGMDLCHREMAVERPVDVIYKLVYESEVFVPRFRDFTNQVESYELTPSKTPFSPGKVVGGFGYIVYEDPRKNRLVIVTERDINRSRAAAQTQDFWGETKSYDEMVYKTIVHRTTAKIPLDPAKVNATAWADVEASRAEAIEAEVAEEAAELGNKEVLSLEQGMVEEQHEEQRALLEAGVPSEDRRGF